MTTPQQSPDAFLMGGGAKSAKFDSPGVIIGGKIVDSPQLVQQKDIGTATPKFWDNGDPMMQLVVKVATDAREDAEDDGIRAIYIKGKMRDAVRDAVRTSGAQGLAIGGTLEVVYTGDGEAKNKGFTPPKLYQARYTAPDPSATFLATPASTAAADPWASSAPATSATAPASAAPAAAPTGLVTLPDGSQVTPEVAALLKQVSA